MTSTAVDFLSGAITLGFFLAGLYFLRFWRRTQDSLFRAFAVAFTLLGTGQAVQTLANIAEEERGYVYLIRLAAFSVIIVAIARKNRSAN